jgi:hypothetical protein
MRLLLDTNRYRDYTDGDGHVLNQLRALSRWLTFGCFKVSVEL